MQTGRRRPAEAARLISAVDKVLTFDEGVVALRFTDAPAETLDGLERRQERQAAVQRELNDLAGQLAAARRAPASAQQMGATAAQVARESVEASQEAQAASTTASTGVAAVESTRQSVDRVQEAAGSVAAAAEGLESSSSRLGGIASMLSETADEVRRPAESTQRHLVDGTRPSSGCSRTSPGSAGPATWRPARSPP